MSNFRYTLVTCMAHGIKREVITAKFEYLTKVQGMSPSQAEAIMISMAVQENHEWFAQR